MKSSHARQPFEGLWMWTDCLSFFGNSLVSRIVACQNVEFEMQNELMNVSALEIVTRASTSRHEQENVIVTIEILI
jgi:hypothetical protein